MQHLSNLLQRNHRWMVHAGSLLPLVRIAWLAGTGGLTVNPIQDLTQRTGMAALIILLISLTCSPVSLLFKFKWAISARRTLGLYAFLYATLHLLIFAGLDYGFNMSLIGAAIIEKRFVLVGFAAFTILLLLAVTSFGRWKAILGKKWKWLHRLVYLAGILGIVHFFWLEKADLRKPIVYGLLLLSLLILRLPAVRRWVS